MAEIRAPVSTENSSVEDTRRSVTYHPSIWRDHFLAYTSDITEITSDEREQLEKQKEKVMKLLAETPNYGTAKIMLIDAIQRLGVEYHFEEEIKESLRQIHDQSSKDNDDDVGVVALRFRLLRQQGYRVPCDVFKKFIDDDGNFKDSLRKDIKGMLSLYEASNYGLHGEGIMDKALEFSSSHLESLDALELEKPIIKSLVRLGVKKFASVYQDDDTCNQDLLSFAKLDFNIVQKGHQRELNYITRWWEDLDFANKLPFARDRVVECYFWVLAVYFEPHYSTARIFHTKIVAMTSVVDDIYDVYGTLDELRRFTDAIPSWDLSAADELPSYMRVCYEALLGAYSEMEKYGESYSYRVEYAKQEMTKLVKAYMEEAEWCYSKYIPTNMDEYMKLGLVSAAYMMMPAVALVGMGDAITKHDFDWITNEPKIVVASSVLARLMDDMAGHGKEEKVTAVSCYMNEYGCSEMEAFAQLSKRVKEAWKDLYEECVEPRAAPMYILARVVNLCRALCIMYVGDDDGYTNSTTRLKDFIQLLLLDPIH